MKRLLITLTLLTIHHSLFTASAQVVWFDGTHPVSYSISKRVDPVVKTALDMFKGDMEQVTGMTPVADSKGSILIVQGVRSLESGERSQEKGVRSQESGVRSQESGVRSQEKGVRSQEDGFRIYVKDGRIVVEGNGGRGTAYGILELSRMAGVSPWVWWGDCVPEKKARLTIDSDFYTEQQPSVAYRGIFLNDEDWSTRHWSYSHFEPADFGRIGPQTYKKIFQLLLRLRANAIWPGMHTGTTAFFRIPGAKAMADSCGIVIGTSHCEPLLRNNVDEWDIAERGAFNYRTNREAVHQYWIERLQEVRKSKDNMFTIGMRGIHDSSMEGYTTEEEKFEGLQQVIDDQQELLRKYIGDPSKQAQVFVPYKEVLQLYEKGLKVPDYVTLMWCDDNYGYMTRLSNAEEQQRSGGGGIYYHLSYWGRPHDYLWLTTTQPGLIYNEMREAYDHNVRKLWIVNVHDPKVAGYDLELFLDMAWDINSVSASTLNDHYKAWLCRQFGQQAGERLFPVMHEFFRLCGQRRPEFMGWNQVEVDKRLYDRGLSQVRNSELNPAEFGNELDRYIQRYQAISSEVEAIGKTIRPELADAYFAAIAYPVEAAAAHAEKMLEAQRARMIARGSTLKDMYDNHDSMYVAIAKSQTAYQRIRQLTDYYNNEMTGGKWKNSMKMNPRDLPVFWAPQTPILLSEKEISALHFPPSTFHLPPSTFHLPPSTNIIARNAADWQQASEGVQPVEMLGHSMKAVALPKGGTLTYQFSVNKEGDYALRTALIPTQPNDDGDLRYSVSIDGGGLTTYSLKEPFRSERWKQNVLRGQALRQQIVHLTAGSHTLTIRAIDDHIVVDQWMIDPKPNRSFYLIPVSED